MLLATSRLKLSKANRVSSDEVVLILNRNTPVFKSGKREESSEEKRTPAFRSGESIFRKEPKIFKTAIIITKKVAPRAVDRNRIRRIISEALREKIGKTEDELVVIVKKNIAHFKKQEVSTIIERLINKL